MDEYRKALSDYLAHPDRTQEQLAAKIGKTQVAVSRYLKNGKDGRFPDAETARAIDAATAGAVPFEIWRQVAAQRFLGEAA